MIPDTLIYELRISRKNLCFYVARYAKTLEWNDANKDELARIVLFRKLRINYWDIKHLRNGSWSIAEVLQAHSNVKKYLTDSDLAYLQAQQWAAIRYVDCVKLIENNNLSTPKQDVLFWGRLAEEKIFAVILGIAIAGINFTFQRRWEDCFMAIVYYLPLVLVYLAMYAIIDYIVWKKRSK